MNSGPLGALGAPSPGILGEPPATILLPSGHVHPERLADRAPAHRARLHSACAVVAHGHVPAGIYGHFLRAGHAHDAGRPPGRAPRPALASKARLVGVERSSVGAGVAKLQALGVLPARRPRSQQRRRLRLEVGPLRHQGGGVLRRVLAPGELGATGGLRTLCTRRDHSGLRLASEVLLLGSRFAPVQPRLALGSRPLVLIVRGQLEEVTERVRLERLAAAAQPGDVDAHLRAEIRAGLLLVGLLPG
mmetsp:Transcript_26860/g.80988  ORF Transcript_26860/g.80988 Transcript_26860/m.80988 type:complete len:247 (-) Transcript_26860:114-854(-)